MVASGPFTSNATLCRQGSSRVRQSRARAGWALATRPRCGAHLRVTALRGDTYKTRTQNTSPRGARGVRNYNPTPGSATRARATRHTRTARHNEREQAQHSERAHAARTTHARRARAHTRTSAARRAARQRTRTDTRDARDPAPRQAPRAAGAQPARLRPGGAHQRATASPRPPPPGQDRRRAAIDVRRMRSFGLSHRHRWGSLWAPSLYCPPGLHTGLGRATKNCKRERGNLLSPSAT